MDKSSDALDSAALSAGFFRHLNGGLMDAGDLAAMGLNSIMGQGMIGNAQNSLMGSGAIANGSVSNAQQAAWNAATLARSPQVTKSYPYKENKPRVEMNLKIVQAENGFIVSLANHYGEVLEPHIAVTIEDICTIITSQLASRMLDRTE